MTDKQMWSELSGIEQRLASMHARARKEKSVFSEDIRAILFMVTVNRKRIGESIGRN